MSNETNQKDNRPHVVIVGGGFGGLNAVKILKNAPVRVTLLDKTNHHLFQPLLYQVATAGLATNDIAAPLRAILRHQKNCEVIMGEVTGVDTARKCVQLGDGEEIAFDYLVLATGARHSYFGKPQWEQFAPGLKTLNDVTEIRERILSAFERAENTNDEAEREANLTFVVVGAGATGAEMAGAISELTHRSLARDFRHIDPTQAKIILIDGVNKILPAYSEPLNEQAKQYLESVGITVMLGNNVEQVDADGVVVGGQRIHARTVIWGAGNAASPAGKWLGVETDKAGRVKISEDCSAPGFPEIFVIGDTMTQLENGKPLPGVAQVAIQQGKYVGRKIATLVANKPFDKPFHYWNKGSLATVGRKFGVAEIGKFRSAGLLGWLLWLGVHIVYLIGFSNRFIVLLKWGISYLTYERGARLIIDEGSHPDNRAVQVLPSQVEARKLA